MNGFVILYKITLTVVVTIQVITEKRLSALNVILYGTILTRDYR